MVNKYLNFKLIKSTSCMQTTLDVLKQVCHKIPKISMYLFNLLKVETIGRYINIMLCVQVIGNRYVYFFGCESIIDELLL